MTFEEAKEDLIQFINKKSESELDKPYTIQGKIARSLRDIKQELLIESAYGKKLIESRMLVYEEFEKAK